MLIVVLQRQRILRTGDPVEIGNHLMRQEVRRTGGIGVFREIDGDRIDGGAGVGWREQKLGVGEVVVWEAVSNWSDVARGRSHGGGYGLRGTCAYPRRHGCGAAGCPQSEC